MGIFDDILETVTGTWKKGVAIEEEIKAKVPALEKGRRLIDPGFAVGETLKGRGGDRKAGEEGDIDDVLAALLREKTEETLALARSAKTTEDLLALDQARTELVQLGTDLPVLREKIGLLENLPEFDEDATAEEVIDAFSNLAPQLAIEGAEEAVALSPEDQAFADLQTRGMTLDIELKEQELESVKLANQQAGMMSLLNMLPPDTRANTIATIMETPALRDELFPGLFGGPGGPAAPGGSAEGDVIDILTQFGGGE